MIIIGRESGADIILPFPQISARHASFEPLGGDNFRIHDLGSGNGTFINGKRITDGIASPSDRVNFGSYLFDWKQHLPRLTASDPQNEGFSIGREVGNHIVLPDPRVSALHARVIPRGNRFLLADCNSSNGIFVNGNRVSNAELTPQDRVTFGTMPVDVFGLMATLGLVLPEARTTPTGLSSCGSRQWIIGSESNCDVTVSSSAVSGRHCKIILAWDGGIFLEDLGSTNGTYVDDQRITEPVRIQPSQRVTLGRQTPLPWPGDLWAAQSSAVAQSVSPIADTQDLQPTQKLAAEHAPGIPLARKLEKPRTPKGPSLSERWKVWYAKPNSPKVAKWASAAMVVLSLTGGMFWWHAAAREHLKQHIAAFDERLTPISEKRKGVFDQEGKALPAIRYAQAEAFLQVFESNCPGLEDAFGRTRQGEGMAFWLPTARSQATDTMNIRVEENKRLAASLRASMAAVQSVQDDVAKTVGNGQQTRNAAVEALAVNSDEEDFASQEAQLAKAEVLIPTALKGVQASEKASSLPGAPEEALRKGLIEGMTAELQEESEALKSRKATMAMARVDLQNYKRDLTQELAGSEGLLAGLNLVSRTLLPAANFAFEQSRPLSELINQAEQPLGGGLFGATLGSPIALMPPTYREAIIVLREICDGTEKFRDEMQQIEGAVSPIVEVTQQFQQGHKRLAMIALSAKSPEAAAYFESKSGIFEPIIQMLESGIAKVDQAGTAAGQSQIPIVSNAAGKIAFTAFSILKSIQGRVLSGRQVITDTAQSMRKVSAMEDHYRTRLTELAGMGTNSPVAFLSTNWFEVPSNSGDVIKGASQVAGIFLIAREKAEVFASGICMSDTQRNSKKLDESAGEGYCAGPCRLNEGPTRKGFDLIAGERFEAVVLKMLS